MALLNRHFDMLAAGERIFVPKYEFSRKMRIQEPSSSIRLKSDEVVIFEGIHALNDIITEKHPDAFKLYISARSNVEFKGRSCSRARGSASCGAPCATISSAAQTRQRPWPWGPTSAAGRS